MRKLLAGIVVLLLVAASFVYGVSVVKYHLFPYEWIKGAKHAAAGHKHGPLWHTRVSIFDVSPALPVVMLGDSITALTDFEGTTNHGISGDTTAGILDRLSVTIDDKPTAVFVLAGINDFADERSVDDVFKDYRVIVQRLRDAGITVYVQSTLHTSAASLRHANPSVSELNRRLSDHCETIGVEFVDLNAVLCPDGTLDARYTLDGIHLNGEGCKVWLQAIHSPLKQSYVIPPH